MDKGLKMSSEDMQAIIEQLSPEAQDIIALACNGLREEAQRITEARVKFHHVEQTLGWPLGFCSTIIRSSERS